MKPYNNIAELIKNLEAEIKELSDDVAMLKQEPHSLNEQIIFR